MIQLICKVKLTINDFIAHGIYFQSEMPRFRRQNDISQSAHTIMVQCSAVKCIKRDSVMFPAHKLETLLRLSRVNDFIVNSIVPANRPIQAYVTKVMYMYFV